MQEIEQECIILNSAWAMIDEMVNWATFVRPEHQSFSNLLFHTHAHGHLFNIRLGDFLSQLKTVKGLNPFGLAAPPSHTRPSNLTFLFYLRQVTVNPKLGPDTTGIASVTEAFASWLEGEFTAEGVNFANIGIVADIRISRLRYLKICGDIAKHHLARLDRNAKHVRDLLHVSGHAIPEEHAYLALSDFFHWFHDNIFNYHSSLIAKFLNDLRWEVYCYLQPEFKRSWHLKEEWTGSLQLYGYHYPEQCSQPVARAMYWELMNRVRSQPIISPFDIAGSLKQRY